ncbi:ribose ABC transporter permease, partial [Burkholderia gladioli]
MNDQSQPGAAGAGPARRETRADAGYRARMQSLMRTAGMLPVLVLLCLGFGLLTDGFASWQNISIVAQQASINIVLAAGMTFVI